MWWDPLCVQIMGKAYIFTNKITSHSTWTYITISYPNVFTSYFRILSFHKHPRGLLLFSNNRYQKKYHTEHNTIQYNTVQTMLTFRLIHTDCDWIGCIGCAPSDIFFRRIRIFKNNSTIKCSKCLYAKMI